MLSGEAIQLASASRRPDDFAPAGRVGNHRIGWRAKISGTPGSTFSPGTCGLPRCRMNVSGGCGHALDRRAPSRAWQVFVGAARSRAIAARVYRCQSSSLRNCLSFSRSTASRSSAFGLALVFGRHLGDAALLDRLLLVARLASVRASIGLVLRRDLRRSPMSV